MSASYPHEDATDLGLEKSEQIYKEWDKFWTKSNHKDGFMSATQDQVVDWNSTHANGSGNGYTNQKRWVFGLRHGERIDLTYGQWTSHCFDDNGKYIRKDLNMPLHLAERVGGKDSYFRDTPLTRVGRYQAQLVGEGLRLAGVSVNHVYSSSALRCVETANYFLEGLQAGPSVKVKVEPGLFEFKLWHQVKGFGPFMTPLELHKAGLNVDLEYKPYIDLDVDTLETIDEFYERNEKVMQTVVNDTEADGGNVIFIGHASTLDIMVTALSRMDEPGDEPFSYQVSKNLLKVPYCALGALRGRPWEVVSPPCPPSMNSSSGRFDWRLLV